MRCNIFLKVIFFLFFLFNFNAEVFAADPQCSGPNAMLAIIDRPSTADSACAVPYHHVMLEIGYNFTKLMGNGYQQDFPQPELRVGLPYHTELFAYLPDFIHQSIAPRNGFASNFIGLKHELGYNASWQVAVEAAYIPPSGSNAFGTQRSGGSTSAIVDYAINPQLSLTTQLGLSNETTSQQAGGERFTSVNPDLVLSWTATNKLQVYFEIYGQSRTAFNHGSGFNADGGILYLLKNNLTFDVEVGQRISGNLEGLQQYVGTGMSVMF